MMTWICSACSRRRPKARMRFGIGGFSCLDRSACALAMDNLWRRYARRVLSQPTRPQYPKAWAMWRGDKAVGP